MIVVTGAGGFIGGHLVARLLADGHDVRGIDLKRKHEWWQAHPAAHNISVDLRNPQVAMAAVAQADQVFNLACDMGGIGFIEANKAACMQSVMINTSLLHAAQRMGTVSRYFFSSSACIYPQALQRAGATALRESDAYPADSEDGYGWEKLFSERMCRHFAEDYGIQSRVARYFTAYGPHGSYDGGREKAPAAICRKIIEAKLTGRHEIDIWGDGQQERSFMYADDVVEGTVRIMASDIDEPVNLGSTEVVTINQLVTLVEEIAGITVQRHHNLNAPQGVRARNSDNTLIQERLGWEPSIRLRDGLERTYAWIYDQITRR